MPSYSVRRGKTLFGDGSAHKSAGKDCEFIKNISGIIFQRYFFPGGNDITCSKDRWWIDRRVCARTDERLRIDNSARKRRQRRSLWYFVTCLREYKIVSEYFDRSEEECFFLAIFVIHYFVRFVVLGAFQRALRFNMLWVFRINVFNYFVLCLRIKKYEFELIASHLFLIIFN